MQIDVKFYTFRFISWFTRISRQIRQNCENLKVCFDLKKELLDYWVPLQKVNKYGLFCKNSAIFAYLTLQTVFKTNSQFSTVVFLVKKTRFSRIQVKKWKLSSFAEVLAQNTMETCWTRARFWSWYEHVVFVFLFLLLLGRLYQLFARKPWLTVYRAHSRCSNTGCKFWSSMAGNYW